MADKHTCRGCGTRTRKHTCPGCGRMWRPMGEILGNDAHAKLTRGLGDVLQKHYPQEMAALAAERTKKAQDASKPAEAPATAPKAETCASGANSTLGDRMAWTIAPRHMHPGAEPVDVIQPEQWRLPKAPLLSFMDDAGEWLDEHPLLAVAGMGLALLVLLAICIVGGR